MKAALAIGKRLFPLRGILWGVVALALLFFSRTSAPAFLPGIMLLASGEALRVWGVGHIRDYRGSFQTVQALATSGPYAYIRNPLYLANGIIGYGIVVLSGVYWFLPVFTVLFALIYLPIVKAEEAYLAGRFGEEYREYCRRVPRFIPRFSPHNSSKAEWSWPVVRCREYHTWLTLAGLVTLFLLRYLGAFRALGRILLGL